MDDRVSRLGSELVSFSTRKQGESGVSLDALETSEVPADPADRLDAFSSLMGKVNTERYTLASIQEAYQRVFGHDLTKDSPSILSQLERRLNNGMISRDDLQIMLGKAAKIVAYEAQSPE